MAGGSAEQENTTDVRCPVCECWFAPQGIQGHLQMAHGEVPEDASGASGGETAQGDESGTVFDGPDPEDRSGGGGSGPEYADEPCPECGGDVVVITDDSVDGDAICPSCKVTLEWEDE